MEDNILHRLGLADRPHSIQVISITRKADGGRDLSKIKFSGWFQPEQIEDPEQKKTLWQESNEVRGGLLPISENPMYAVDAKSVTFDLVSGKTRLRLARFRQFVVSRCQKFDVNIDADEVGAASEARSESFALLEQRCMRALRTHVIELPDSDINLQLATRLGVEPKKTSLPRRKSTPRKESVNAQI